MNTEKWIKCCLFAIFILCLQVIAHAANQENDKNSILDSCYRQGGEPVLGFGDKIVCIDSNAIRWSWIKK